VTDESVSPVVVEVIPSSVSAGDTIAVVGMYFGDDSVEVVFGSSAEAVVGLNSEGTVATVAIPSDASSGSLNMYVRKPDPDSSGEYLASNLTVLTVT
jgi:hypothetical protein